MGVEALDGVPDTDPVAVCVAVADDVGDALDDGDDVPLGEGVLELVAVADGDVEGEEVELEVGVGDVEGGTSCTVPAVCGCSSSPMAFTFPYPS